MPELGAGAEISPDRRVEVIRNFQVDTQSQPLLEPDGKNVIWPTVRDIKADIAAVLNYALENFNLCDITVNEIGSFEASQLTNEDGAAVPVITINRVSDQTQRYALGDFVGAFHAGDANVLDPNKTLGTDGSVQMFGEWSIETVDITICDLDGYRANQTYLLVKHILLAAQTAFRELGYLEFKRVNGSDQVNAVDAPGAGLIHTRVLTYQCNHADYLAALDDIVPLIAQRMTVIGLGDTTGPVESTAIGNPPPVNPITPPVI